MSPTLPERDVALQVANRQHLLSALQKLGVQQVKVRYGGKKDRCTHCLVNSVPSDKLADMHETKVIQVSTHTSLNKAGITDATTTVQQALKDFTLHWVELQHLRWTHDEGSAGIMTVDVSSRQFTLEHDVYLTENFCYRLVD